MTMANVGEIIDVRVAEGTFFGKYKGHGKNIRGFASQVMRKKPVNAASHTNIINASHLAKDIKRKQSVSNYKKRPTSRFKK